MKKIKAKYIGISKLGLTNGKTFEIIVMKNSSRVKIPSQELTLDYDNVFEFLKDWTSIKNA